MGEGRRGSPLPFFENWKKVPLFGQKCLDCGHLSKGKISHLKSNFKEFPVKKIGDLFPAGFFFPVLKVNVY